MALIKFIDYANDEIALEGFAVMPIEIYNDYMTKLRHTPDVFPFEFYYSSTHFVIYESYSDFVKNFSVLLIPSNIEWEMQQYLNMYKVDEDCYTYGMFPIIEEEFYQEE